MNLTPSELDYLKSHFGSLSLRRIAFELKRPTSTVRITAIGLGLCGDAGLARRILELNSQGMCATKISTELGCCRFIAAAVIRLQGRPAVARIVELHRAGFFNVEIAKRLSIDPQTVALALAKHGLKSHALNTERRMAHALRVRIERQRSFRVELAADYGLPTNLSARAVQTVLRLLHGPSTALQVRQSTGLSKPYLRKVLAHLHHAGLVAIVPQSCESAVRCVRAASLYMLTGYCLDLLANAPVAAGAAS